MLSDVQTAVRNWDAGEDSREWSAPPTTKEGGRITTDMRVNIYKMGNVDSVAGTLDAKIGIFHYWNDSRLIGWNGPLPSNLWGPRMRLNNAAPGLDECNVEFAIVDSTTGRLKRCRMYTGTMLCAQEGK